MHPATSLLTEAEPSYRDALAWLMGRINYERLAAIPYRSGQFRLERMRRLLEGLGNPDAGMPIVHVAGTKGKGSTSAMIASMLVVSGYRTGLFTSPHLERVEERMAVDGRICSAERFVELVGRVRPVVETMDGEGQAGKVNGRAAVSARRAAPTYFEITTAMALLHFRRANVDVAILEVGLGGRLDSTNVCTPEVCVITSISMDHMRVLGETVSEIAREKAGIIKEGVPVVSGVREEEPRQEIRQQAQTLACPLVELGADFDFRYRAPRQIDRRADCGTMDFEAPPEIPHPRLSDVRLGLLGHHQAANAAVALATVNELRRKGWKISDEAMRQGLADAFLPARIEIISRCPTVIIDTAHNLASIESLVRVLEESCVLPRRRLVFASSKDKDAAAMLRILGPRFDELILTRFRDNPRAVNVEDLVRTARQTTGTPFRAFDEPAQAWQYVLRTATPHHLIVITGSFFLAAEMRRLIQR